MDPYLRTIHPWDQNYLPSEKEAYYQARINGYLFSQRVGRFDSIELERIASHPPTIPYNEYIKYREMSLDQLKKEFPEVSQVIYNPTEEDLFYWATRGYIPEYNQDNKVKHQKQYNDLSDLGKNLMDRLPAGHSLERSVVAFDEHLDNYPALLSIADEVGFNGDNTVEGIYLNFLEHLKNIRK